MNFEEKLADETTMSKALYSITHLIKRDQGSFTYKWRCKGESTVHEIEYKRIDPEIMTDKNGVKWQRVY